MIFHISTTSFSGGDLPGDLTMNPKSSVVGYYGSDLISDNLMEMERGKGDIHYYFKTKLACYSIVLPLLSQQCNADFSTPNKSWKEGHCVGTIRKMLEIENPV